MTLEYQLVPLATVALKLFPLLMKVTLNKLKSKVPVHVVPMLPGSYWFLCHRRIPLLDFKTAWKKLDVDHVNEDGLCSFWTGTRPAVAIFNVAKTAIKILNSSSLKPELAHATKHIKQLAGEHSLLHMHGEEWKANRNAFTLAPSGKCLKKM
jgi:hypothetical protein